MSSTNPTFARSLFIKGGDEVTVNDSRGVENLPELVAELGEKTQGLPVEGTSKFGKPVLVAIPFGKYKMLLSETQMECSIIGLFIETKTLPIPVDLERRFSPPPLVAGPGKFPSAPKQVYLAGPFFTMAQRWMIEQSREQLLGQGFKVFSPLHDVGYGSAPEVVPADIEALDKSDVVFAVVDGLDSGTLFEVGYARAMNKPVVAFVQNESQNNLKMLEGTHCEIADDFASAIYRVTWTAMEL